MANPTGSTENERTSVSALQLRPSPMREYSAGIYCGARSTLLQPVARRGGPSGGAAFRLRSYRLITEFGARRYGAALQPAGATRAVAPLLKFGVGCWRCW